MDVSPEEVKPKKTFKERFRYFFDNLMSRGTLSLIGFLAIISLALIIIFTIILWLIDLLPGKGLLELFWLNIFKTLNTGTLSGAVPGQLNFLLSFLIALASIFITSLLIGLLTAGIQQKIWSLRQGRSKVIESDHTIILGYSEIIFTIIRALNEAAANHKSRKIVIMASIVFNTFESESSIIIIDLDVERFTIFRSFKSMGLPFLQMIFRFLDSFTFSLIFSSISDLSLGAIITILRDL